MADVFRLQGRVDLDTSAAERGFQNLGQQVQSFASSIGQGLAIGAGIAAVELAVRGVEAAFGDLKSSVLDFNQTVDMAQTTFTRYFKGNQQAAADFMETLKQFANVTPFEFADLVPLAVKLQNANLNAKDIIPTLRAIGEASSATGQISKANIDRISLALTQMSQTGHVTGQDMRQLTEALVPAWDILAQATGKPIPVLQKLASEGQISSQVFLEAFRKYYDGAGLMEAASKTLGGALSTVRDVGTQAFAEMGRSVYVLATDGANALAKFLSTEQFQSWVQAGTIAVSAITNGVRSLISGLSPLGDAFAAAFSKLGEGDISGALGAVASGFSTVLGNIWTAVTEFASSMLGAGSNVVASFAEGMLSGGLAAVQAAIDAIASIIASFFIGQSPPPAGPLSQIDVGGTNTAKAFTDAFGTQMKAGAGEAVAGFDATIQGLKDKSRAVAEEIRGITAESQELDRAMRGVRDRIETIKDALAESKRGVTEAANETKQRYADALDAVREKIATIKDAHKDAADVVQHQIQAIQDAYGAAIDTVKARIDGVREHYDAIEVSLQRTIDATKDRWTAALDGVKARIASISEAEQRQLDPLERQLQNLQDANKYLKERQSAEQAIANAKLQQLQLEALGDPKLRAQLAGQLAVVQQQEEQVDLQKQLAEAQAKLAAGGVSPIEAQALELKIKQLTIQQQLANLVNQTALGQAASQQVLLEASQQQTSITNGLTEAGNKLKAIPIEEKINAIKATAANTLEPLQRRLKEIEVGQKAALTPLEANLKRVKAEEADALVPLQRRLKELEAGQKAALDPLQHQLKAIKDDEEATLKPLEEHARALQKQADEAARVYAAMLASIEAQGRSVLGPIEAQLKGYQQQKQALQEQLQELQRIKAEIAEQIAMVNEAKRAAKAGGGTVPGPPDLGFDPDKTAKEMAERAKAAGATIASNVGEGLKKWWEDHKSEIAEGLVGGTLGFIIGGPLGAAIGAFVVPALVKRVNEKLREQGFDAQPFIDAFAEGVETGNWAPVAEKITYSIARGFFHIPAQIEQSLVNTLGLLLSGAAGGLENSGGVQSIGAAIIRGIVRAVRDTSPIDLITAIDLFTFSPAIIGDIVVLVYDKFKDAAQAIIDGFIDGLHERDHLIADAIPALVDLIVTKFKELLGIGSPSTVFAGFGADIIDGLYGGLVGQWESKLRGWWSDFGDLVQRTLGWTGGVLTWSDDLIAIGSETVDAISRGAASFWAGTLEPWWASFKTLTQTALGWTGSALGWAVDLTAAGSAMLSNIWVGLDAYWTSNLEPWWRGFAGATQTALGWVGGALAWAESMKSAGTATLASYWVGLDAYWSSNLGPWLAGFKGAVFTAIGVVAGAPVDWLLGVGQETLRSFAQGLSDVFGSEDRPDTVKGIMKQVTDWIPEWIRNALGVHSPSQVMYDLGSNIMHGLAAGLRSKFPDVQTTIREAIAHVRGIGGMVGGDLDQWLSMAISLTGVPGSWLEGLRWLAEHESSGDPTQVNPVGVGPGGSGEHAAGLMQTIPSTFESYRSNDLPDDIFNPIANAIASIRYIMATYPGGIDQVISGWASRGGYGRGGVAWGPQVASLAEYEPEAIIPKSWFSRAGSGAMDVSSGAVTTHRFIVQDPSGHILADWYVRGHDQAVTEGRVRSS